MKWVKGKVADSIVHHGPVGINTDRPFSALTVNGNVAVTGSLMHPSDLRIKEQLEPMDNKQQLENVKAMRLYEYQVSVVLRVAPDSNLQASSGPALHTLRAAMRRLNYCSLQCFGLVVFFYLNTSLLVFLGCFGFCCGSSLCCRRLTRRCGLGAQVREPWAEAAGRDTEDRREVGVIAQNMQQVLPDAVKETGENIGLSDGSQIDNLLIVDKVSPRSP